MRRPCPHAPRATLHAPRTKPGTTTSPGPPRCCSAWPWSLPHALHRSRRMPADLPLLLALTLLALGVAWLACCVRRLTSRLFPALDRVADGLERGITAIV